MGRGERGKAKRKGGRKRGEIKGGIVSSGCHISYYYVIIIIFLIIGLEFNAFIFCLQVSERCRARGSETANRLEDGVRRRQLRCDTDVFCVFERGWGVEEGAGGILYFS